VGVVGGENEGVHLFFVKKLIDSKEFILFGGIPAVVSLVAFALQTSKTTLDFLL
jgi:hypothetical protein